MNANELADYLENDFQIQEAVIDMLRQQQAVIEDLEKENTDLRYLIATKLEQQDGISLNSMAHPITNTPEPSYEIDPDKLETIEIDLPSPEPVAWAVWEGSPHDLFFTKEEADELCRLKGGDAKSVALYTYPVKNLEDIDINITWNENSMRDFGKDELNFARAILRKAQDERK